ncbi:MAG: ABC transporter permease subunit [Streptosporangiales bacterium]|nr:ABC transporter permease subunit [Streptosporangiales bacterium]
MVSRDDRGGHRRRVDRVGLLLVAPAVVIVAAFTLYPLGYAVYTSTRISSPLLEGRFVGFENYRNVVTSSYFLDAAGTTAAFVAVTLPVLMALGVAVALLLTEPFFGNTLLRAAMLLPWAIPAAAAGVIWKWVFLDDAGALNASLYSLGVIDGYVPWLTTPTLARMAVVVVFIWTQLPLVSILLLAALRTIQPVLYDAAAVDGASVFRRFLHVTLPGIRPMLVIVGVYEGLVAIATFDLTFSLTGGGPGTSTTLLAYFVWSETFKQLNFGQGAALAVVIALVSLVGIFGLLRALPADALLGEER